MGSWVAVVPFVAIWVILVLFTVFQSYFKAPKHSKGIKMRGKNKYPFSKVVTLMRLGSKIAQYHGSQLYIELRMTLGWPLPKMFKWVYVVALVGHRSKKRF